jgi:hypothetical protein
MLFICEQLEALVHPFFDDLREPNACLPNGRPLPPLFNFQPHGIGHLILFRFPKAMLNCMLTFLCFLIRTKGSAGRDDSQADS